MRLSGIRGIMEPAWQKKIYLVYTLIIIFSIFGYGIQKVCCFTLFPDEFGYWASAAHLTGYDWSDMTALGSYYSFGYGLLLFPILKFFSDGILAYRAAIVLNMILMCVSLFLLQSIIRELFPEESEVQRVFISSAAVLYPSWIFYMQMTMTEALLMFLMVLTVRLLILLLRNSGRSMAAGLAVVCAYMYCVHMRTLGVMVACVIVVCLWAIEKPQARKQALLFLLVLLAAIIMAYIFKRYTVAEVFPNVSSKRLAHNDYGGFWSKIKSVFTRSGIIHITAGIMGKIFYLGLASFGLFYWAMGWCLKGTAELVRAFKRNEEKKETGYMSLFLLLAAISEILVCAIYMASDDNVDALIYGRYNDFLVPVLMVTGIYALRRSRYFLRFSLLWGAVSGVMAILLFILVEAEKRTRIRGYMVVGICYLINRDNFDPHFYFAATWLMGAGMILLTAGFVRLSGSKGNRAWIMGGILAMEVVLGLYASHEFLYHYNETHFIDKAVAETIQAESEENDPVFYLKEDNTKYISAIQMMLGSQRIQTVQEDAFLEGAGTGNFLIVRRDTKHREKLKELYKKRVETNTFILYYNKREE